MGIKMINELDFRKYSLPCYVILIITSFNILVFMTCRTQHLGTKYLLTGIVSLSIKYK